MVGEVCGKGEKKKSLKVEDEWFLNIFCHGNICIEFFSSDLLKENTAPEKNMWLEFKMCIHVKNTSKDICVAEPYIRRITCEVNSEAPKGKF